MSALRKLKRTKVEPKAEGQMRSKAEMAHARGRGKTGHQKYDSRRAASSTPN